MTTQKNSMKTKLILSLISFTATVLLAGCISPGSTSYGGPTTVEHQYPTVGEQLIDLQKAKDMGVISDAEYQAGKAKILNGNDAE